MQQSGIARRTRSQWDAFYRNRYYHQINSNSPTPTPTPVCSKTSSSGSSSSDDDDDDDFSDKNIIDQNVGVGVGNNRNHKGIIRRRRRRRKVGRPKKILQQQQDDHLIDEEFNSINTALLLLDSSSRIISKNKDPLPSKIKTKIDSNDAVLTLPLKFKLQDYSCLPDKPLDDFNNEIHSLFQDLDMGLWEEELEEESQNGKGNPSMTNDDIDECTTSRDTRAARCKRGDHETVIDEQIGYVCKYCFAVLLDIKYILPPFHVHTSDPHEWKYCKDTNKPALTNQLQFKGGSASANLESSSVHSQGTVLDFIPDTVKELYPHQLEGFKFLWTNIAGDIHLDKLQNLPVNGGRGCIISHTPGTGKTRLTIVFLQTFMKLYPTCRPVIIAPVGMLLTWEQEFKKWNVDIKFHNLNKTRLSSQEDNSSSEYSTRLGKLSSWTTGGSILGISYSLFEQLAGEHENNNSKLKRVLMEMPDLLVLDEGHTARSEQSLTWNTLTKVKTGRRVMLSGTPFQNNFDELYNTFSLVNPGFSYEIMPPSFRPEQRKSGRKRKLINAARGEWANMTSSISKKSMISSGDFDLKKIRSMMEPFVHIYKGGILEKNLPGMRDWLIILKPTELQKELLDKISARSDRFLERDHMASLISVHPALVAEKPEFLKHRSRLRSLESDPDAGVKTRFLVKLIQLSGLVNEKVLIFSQFIPPLRQVIKLLERHFSWKEGRQVIYIDGHKTMNERQELMRSFNDKSGEAKVLLASQKACSEGINLVGASRVVLLDVVWNPSVERQAICRAYRLGQEKVVHVYRLLTLGEVNKYKRQAEKERLSELIFGPGSSAVKTSSNAEFDDKVLEAMVGHQSLACMFERIVPSPKDSTFTF